MSNLSPRTCQRCGKETTPLINRVLRLNGKKIRAWICDSCEQTLEAKATKEKS